jgi:acyl-phosphate glycerol 3-phosphate acyltransferase
MTQTLLTTLGIIVVSYVLGCFSTAYYLVRWRTGQDIRAVGSGTAGARNVGRVLGKGGFALTFLGDALKGVLAVGLARWLDLPAFSVVAAMLAVTIGHLWPVQLGGKGGKGASTALGCVTTIHPLLGAGTLILALIFLGITRSFNRGGMIAMALAPVIAWLLGLDWVLVVGVFALILLLLYAHRENWSKDRASAPAQEKPTSVETPT